MASLTRARWARCLAFCEQTRGKRSVLALRALDVRRVASGPSAPQKDHRVWHLPEWAKEEKRPPRQMLALGAALLLPLGVGSLAVHFLDADAEESEEAEIPSTKADLSRLSLNWSLHYAGALLSSAGAMHWGMQLAEIGVPKRSEYMSLYYLCRFSAPAVFVFFGWVGSVFSTALPFEAALWLLSGFAGLLSFDFLAGAFRITPAWWFRWRAGFNLSAISCILVLLLSERNLYLGQKPKMRM
mmetsp:Transcript_51154/g.105781  ORF Transcript_51154/g.105781 Transcript_51154/m.105781 type:complete len:242 (-) Transcript_51154:17-742(-)